MTHLDLDANDLGDAGAVILVRARNVAALRQLSLAQNGIGDHGARALLELAPQARLKRLDLRRNDFSMAMKETLRGAFGARLLV